MGEVVLPIDFGKAPNGGKSDGGGKQVVTPWRRPAGFGSDKPPKGGNSWGGQTPGKGK